jgi:hypothetical protein
MDMRELIKKLLKEYTDEYIQNVDFDGFSEPILIPQFNMYIVKFNGTGRVDKVSDSEKIVFRDKGGKEYIFDSNDVQKSGSGPFYISLDVLRRNYDIRFKDDFVRYKKNLTQREHYGELRDASEVYVMDGRCTNIKCSELRSTIKNSLKEMYGDNYGTYESTSCSPIEGFLNVYPIEGTDDKNGNQWSKLNYIIFEPKVTTLLLITYLKKYGTFDHKDFIDWVKEDKGRLFNGEFLKVMFNSINLPKVDMLYGESLIDNIRKLFPNAKVVSSFCTSMKNDDGDSFVVSHRGNRIVFQPVRTKSKNVLRHDGKYYLRFGRRTGAPNLNRSADYFITQNGIIFQNDNVISGERAWEFGNSPVYNENPYDTELMKTTKLK